MRKRKQSTAPLLSPRLSVGRSSGIHPSKTLINFVAIVEERRRKRRSRERKRMMGQKEDNKKKLTKTRKCKRSKEKESGTGKGNVKR